MNVNKIKLYSSKEDRMANYKGEDRVISSHELKKELEHSKSKITFSVKSLFPKLDKVTEGFEAGELVIVSGYTGHGKCHGRGTKILMFDGSIKKVEDVRVGDLLMGDDSKPRKVLSLATGKDIMWKVIPTKGEPYTVNSSHILSLKLTGLPKAFKTKWKKGQIIDISVKDYLQASSHFKYLAKGWRAPVHFKKKHLPLSPYFLGLWLGDGTSTRPEICTADKEIKEYLNTFAKSLNLKLTVKKQNHNKSKMYYFSTGKRKMGGYNLNPITKVLREFNLIKNKHIPLIYKTGSENQRLELLAGLIDSDGYKNQPNNLEFSTKNLRLAEDILFLARSLGFGAYLYKKKQKNYLSYRISLSGNLTKIPIKIQRKKCTERKQIKNVLLTGIKLQCLGLGRYYGFELDGNGRYLLGDFTVTHNTSFCQSLTVNFKKQGVNTLWFSYEMPARQFFAKFQDLPVFYLPRKLKDSSLQWIEDRIIEAKIKYNIKIVMIDHLHFLLDFIKIQHPSLEIGAIVRSLKRMAMRHNIIIFLIAHTSMPRGNKIPGLDAIRDSSFITQEADSVMVIQRILPMGQSTYGNDSWLTILKHRRMGTIGQKVKLLYRNKQFYEIDDREVNI